MACNRTEVIQTTTKCMLRLVICITEYGSVSCGIRTYCMGMFSYKALLSTGTVLLLSLYATVSSDTNTWVAENHLK